MKRLWFILFLMVPVYFDGCTVEAQLFNNDMPYMSTAESDPIAAAINGILKSDGNTLSALTSFADLQTIISDAVLLKAGTLTDTKYCIYDSASGTVICNSAGGGAPEGTAVLSTGEGGGTKFLREDGDGTCSWQAAGGGATALDDIGDPDAATTITMGDNEAITLTSAEDTGTVLTINMTDNDMAGNTFGLDIIHAGDANSVYQFMRCYDNTNDLQFSITSNGNVTGGTLTSRSWMLNEGGNYISQRLSDTAAIVPEVTLRKARDGTPTSDVSDDDYLGQVTFEGYHTDGYDTGATIRAIVDGTPGNTDMPARLEFLVSPDASATPVLALTINNAGNFDFQDGNLTTTGTFEAATLTQGGQAMYDANDVPGGELGGTFASFTINDNITVTGWVMGASTATTPAANDADTSLATTAFCETTQDYLKTTEWTAASTTAQGKVELATTAEVNTGTDTTRAATPDSIRDSNYTPKVFMVRLIDEDTSHTVDASIEGDYRMPFAGTIIDVGAYFDTAGTTSVTTMDINEAGSTILSTLITVDATEKTSTTAATPPVISDASYAADAILTFEVTGIASGTAGKGLVMWVQIIPTSL